MPLDYTEFAKKVKSKYPEYNDIDDLTLAKKMIEKYPEYKNEVSFDSTLKKKRGFTINTRRWSCFIGYTRNGSKTAFGIFISR